MPDVTFKQWLKLPDYQSRPYVYIKPNFIEFCGSAMLCTGIYLIAGLGTCLLVGSVVLIVAAELVFRGPIRIPVPRRPHLIRRMKTWRH